MNLLNSLPEEEYRFTIVTLTPGWDLRSRIRRPDVPTVCLGIRPGRDLSLVPRLVALFRRIRPDLLHTRNWPTIEGVAAGRLAGIRRIVHGEHGVNLDEADGLVRRRALGRRAAYPLVDRVIAVSEAVRDRIRRRTGAAPSKVVAIPNGVDTELFLPGDGAAARQRLGLSAANRVIGAVGRLDPVKDHATLFRAFAELAPARPDLRLVLVGDGPHSGDLRVLARELDLADRILMAGARDDLPDLLRAFDVFALPSRTEGLSNTLLEALASGIPAVATRVGGNPEVLDGVGGALVPPADPAALAEAVAALLDDPAARARAGREGRERVVRRFSLPAMTDAYDRLYRELLGRTLSKTNAEKSRPLPL